jgi:hypothetical protein
VSDATDRRLSPSVVVGALLALGVALGSCGTDNPESGAGGRFEDRTRAAGITFRTDFLPNEQGEKFKINLYDHGGATTSTSATNSARTRCTATWAAAASRT